LPKPVQRPRPPIVIGGYGQRRTPKLAARFASEFNLPFPPLEIYRDAVSRVRAACEDAGRDPSTLRTTVALVVCCATNEDELARRAKNIGREVAELRQNGAAGTPAELVDKLGAYGEAGAETTYLQVLDLDDLDHVRLIAQEVMPKVADV
jgi:alkanesulfonate monooxygenase